MDSALTPDDSANWKPCGTSSVRMYSGSRQITLPQVAQEVAGLTIGGTVSLATRDDELRAFSLGPEYVQERRVREQGASVVLPLTKDILDAAGYELPVDVALEGREGELRITREDEGQEVGE